MRNRRFFKKLLVAYIVIIFSYTLVTTGVFFFKNNEIVQLELNNNHKVFLQQSRNSIDTKILIAFNHIKQLKYNEDVMNYGRNENIDYYNVTRIHNALRHNTNATSSFGYTLGISKITDDMVVTPQNTWRIHGYYKELNFDEKDINQIEEYFNQEVSLKDYIIVKSRNDSMNQNQDSLITIVKKERLGNNSLVVFFLTFYENNFLPPLISDNSQAFAVIADNEVISNKSWLSGKEALISNEKLTELNRVNVDEALYSRIKYGKFTVHSIRSRALDVTNWQYIYITPNNIVSSEIKDIAIKTTIAYLIFTLIGILIAFIAAKKTYKPINSIMDVFVDFHQESREDELSFIKEAAINIRQTNDNLKQIIENNKLPLKTKFLRDLLFGLLTEDRILSGIEKYGIEFSESKLCVVLLQFINYKYMEESYSREAIAELKEKIALIIKEGMKEVGILELIELDYKRYGLILNEMDSEKIRKTVNYMLSNIELDNEISLVAAIGQPSADIFSIDNSYNSALSIMESRTPMDRKVVCTTEDVEQLNNEAYHYPLDVERNLISAVIRGEEEQARAILNQVILKNFQEKDLNGEIINEFIFSLVATVNRVFQQMNRVYSDFFNNGNTPYKQLMECKNKKELANRILYIFNIIASKINSDSEQIDNNLADRMISFIHDNYNRDIALCDIAEHFNLSTGYISTMFKVYTGDNFKDYLNIYRVERAKELLEKGEYKVNEVAGMVGCNNLNTFLRIFKKYVGISPGQYTKNR
jgi:two-component system, response regulator YesN